jgi:hypothetical protein
LASRPAGPAAGNFWAGVRRAVAGMTAEEIAADLERWLDVLTGFCSFVEQH